MVRDSLTSDKFDLQITSWLPGLVTVANGLVLSMLVVADYGTEFHFYICLTIV